MAQKPTAIHPPELLVQCDEDISHCFGCGPDNPYGLRIQSYWDGREGTCRFQPQPHHCGYNGLFYGGLIACLIDCHTMNTAVAATYEAEGRPYGSRPGILYITANLNVDYIRPVPLGKEVLLRAVIAERTERKAVVTVDVEVDGEVHARGRVTGVRTPSELDGENPRLANHD